jgi:hypothetical protein
MKAITIFTLLSTLLATLALSTASIADTGTATQNYRLQQIAANAGAAGANAHIYQWRRVNLEVDRIDADEHALEIAGVAGDANQALMLRQAVLNLRSARQEHDTTAVQESAAQVITACESLLNSQNTQ